MADVRLSLSTPRGKRERKHEHEHKRDADDASTILKFSGSVPGGAGVVTSFLTDGGETTVASSTAPRYPLPEKFKARFLTCNLLDGATPPPGGSLICQLVKNGVPVPDFLIAYAPGQTGVAIFLLEKGKTFNPGDTLGLAMIATGFSGSVGAVSAMLSPGRGGNQDLCTALCRSCNNNCTFNPFTGACTCPPVVKLL